MTITTLDLMQQIAPSEGPVTEDVVVFSKQQKFEAILNGATPSSMGVSTFDLVL